MKRCDMRDWKSKADYNGDTLLVDFRGDTVEFDANVDTPLLKVDDVKTLITKLQEWVDAGASPDMVSKPAVSNAEEALTNLPDRRPNYPNSVYLTIPDYDVPGDYMVIDVGYSGMILIAVHEGDVKSEILVDPRHVLTLIHVLKRWYDNTREQD
jgi:hypothetical protein